MILFFWSSPFKVEKCFVNEFTLALDTSITSQLRVKYLRLRIRHIALPSLTLEGRANTPLMNGMNHQYDTPYHLSCKNY